MPKEIISSVKDDKPIDDFSEPPEANSIHVDVSERELAKLQVRQQAVLLNTLLIKRSKVVLAIVIITLITLLISISSLLPTLKSLYNGATLDTPGLVTLVNILMQACTAGYLARAKDPDNAQQVLKILIIFNCLESFLGFYSYNNSLFLTFLNLGLLCAAYLQMPKLKSGKG